MKKGGQRRKEDDLSLRSSSKAYKTFTFMAATLSSSAASNTPHSSSKYEFALSHLALLNKGF